MGNDGMADTQKVVTWEKRREDKKKRKKALQQETNSLERGTVSGKSGSDKWKAVP